MDSYQRIAMTKSILFDRSLITSEYGVVKYAPLQPVLMAPLYLLGYSAGTLIGQSQEQRHRTGYRFCAFLFTPIIVSITCVLYFNLISHMNFKPMVMIISTFSLLFGTLMLPYARIMFSEPLNALLIFIATYNILLFRKKQEIRYINLALITIGILCTNNIIFVLHYFLISSYALIYTYLFKSKHDLVKTMIYIGTVLFGITLVWSLYNYARFGHIFVFGYGEEGFNTPFLVGFYGLLFSIGRGAFIYTPLTMLCVIYFIMHYPKMTIEFRHVGLLFTFLFGVHVYLYSIWDSFEGGWCWGPRFLLPFVPVLHLSFPYIVQSFHKLNPLAKCLFVCLCGCALFVNVVEYIGYWEHYERTMFDNTGLSYMVAVFDPEYASLLHGWPFDIGIQQIPQFIIVGALTFSALAYLRRKKLLDRE